MSESKQPSRLLLIIAGALTQLTGAACLVLGLASLPVIHDLHTGTHSVIASIVAALAAIVCGTLVYRGRLVPLALAAGLDIGFGVGLPRGGTAIGALLHFLPADDAATADALVTTIGVTMLVAAVMCLIAVPTAINLRKWARLEIERAARGETVPPESTASLPTLGDRPPPPADTLKGFGPSKLVPTQVLRAQGSRARGKPFVVIGVAVTLIALGIVVITAASGSKTTDTKITMGSAAPAKAARDAQVAVVATAAVDAQVADAGVGPDSAESAAAPTVDEFMATFHVVLGGAKAVELEQLFDAKAFAFGVEAHEVVQGRDAVVAMLRHDLGDPPAGGFKVEPKFDQAGRDGDIAWLAEEVRVGAKTFVMTAMLGLHEDAWTIAALQWAVAMPNETAYKLGREGGLAVPDAIPDTHDASPLAVAMRTAFASKPSFVEARSTRADAFNFGSAPGERIAGGDAIRKTFARIRATVKLHDAVAVGTVGDRGGWGAANVEFTDADRDGTDVTQTFRVLAVWVHEDAGWRIVQTQWSNAR